MIRPLVVLLGVTGAVALAEGHAERDSLPSTATRLRGADTIMVTPLGLVGVGGSSLRLAKSGSTTWELVHRIEGDALSRIAADSERLMAVWEKDPNVHLFVPSKKTHVTFAKPPPTKLPPLSLWSVSQLAFDGAWAIVAMSGSAGRAATMVVSRVALDGSGKVDELFRQPGYSLYESGRVFVFAVAKNPEKTCDNGGCAMSGVIAWQLTSEGARSRMLVMAKGDELRWAGPLFGSNDERIGFFTGKQLWRWYPAEDRLESSPGDVWSGELNRYRFVGDEVVTVPRGGGTATVVRLKKDGTEKTVTIAPPPRGDIDSAWDTNVYGVGARDDRLFVHIGNMLVLIDAEGRQRSLNLEPILKRRNEWAGVAIPTKDAVWLGVEVGGSRDYVQLSWSDFDKRAK